MTAFMNVTCTFLAILADLHLILPQYYTWVSAWWSQWCCQNRRPLFWVLSSLNNLVNWMLSAPGSCVYVCWSNCPVYRGNTAMQGMVWWWPPDYITVVTLMDCMVMESCLGCAQNSMWLVLRSVKNLSLYTCTLYEGASHINCPIEDGWSLVMRVCDLLWLVFL